MNTIGIIVALWSEGYLLYKSMENVEIVKYANVKYYIGKIHSYKVIFAASGIGKINAAIVTQNMISNFGVDLIINSGSAGSINEGVKVGDIVIANELVLYDASQVYLKFSYPFRNSFIPDLEWVDIFFRASNSEAVIGQILTGDKFIDNESDRINLKNSFNDALCVDMESGAIAYTAFLNKIPFVVVRGISDTANANATDFYKRNERISADNAAKVILQGISLNA